MILRRRKDVHLKNTTTAFPTNVASEVTDAFANLGLLPILNQKQPRAELTWFQEGPFKTNGSIEGKVEKISLHHGRVVIDFLKGSLRGDVERLPRAINSTLTEKLDAYLIASSLHFKYAKAEGSVRYFRVTSPHNSVLTIGER